MSRTVMCTKLGREAEALEEPPLRGPLGREIFENVSKEAWLEWEEMQLKIVNEYHLDLAEKKDRTTLHAQLRTFLGLDGGGEAMEVGTPPEQE